MQFSYGTFRIYSSYAGVPRRSHLGGESVPLGRSELSGKIGSDAGNHGKGENISLANKHDAWPRGEGSYTDSTAPLFSGLSEKEPANTISPVLLRLTELWLGSAILREHDHS